ncbi:hypothetical protein BXZ70DRAFT_956854 [Cristinia sonorae]|uniref:Uncharacterized protein n=1 Tax=Cristinia sonorae TaxID=1940300 RepID=A0A8K0UGT0_9AGAR|nr:hypothetical protein BXZ70DRAFT_956854 [Cristinia sonorae]
MAPKPPPLLYHVPKPKQPTLLHRVRTQCTTFISKLRPNRSTSEPAADQNTRSLRTLYLSPETRQRTREHTRHMFQTTHRLNLSLSQMRNPFTPPQTPRTPSRRLYSPLDDDESVRRPKRPVAALLSPWSPSEQDYPYADSGRVPLIRSHNREPATPPPMHPPPRVYVPETPLRGGFGVDKEDTWDKIGSDPFGDPKRVVESEDVVRKLRQRQKELEAELREQGVFIVGEEDDWDDDSDTGSLYSIPSTVAK